MDAGTNNYATVVVRDTKTGRIAHQTTLSQKAHSLWNSVRASERQARALRRKATTSLHDRQARMPALDEAQPHREAASRKKHEPAILAAQEIAYLSHAWRNAVVAVEDLSWIANTMQSGMVEPRRTHPMAHPLRHSERRMGREREPREHAATVPRVRPAGHTPHARGVRLRRARDNGPGRQRGGKHSTPRSPARR